MQHSTADTVVEAVCKSVITADNSMSVRWDINVLPRNNHIAV
jgi:hypothetical protein